MNFPELKSGYQVLPSGLILQWWIAEVRTATSNDVSNEVRLPLSFPNAALTIQLAYDATGKEGERTGIFFMYKILDKSKFFVRVDHSGGSYYTFTPTSWFALGY